VNYKRKNCLYFSVLQNAGQFQINIVFVCFYLYINPNVHMHVWIVRAWRSEDVVLYGKVGPPLLS